MVPHNESNTPATYTFTLSAVGPSGTATATTSVVVAAIQQPAINVFEATPNQIGSFGGTIQFAWSGANVDNWCIVEPDNFPGATKICVGTNTNVAVTVPANTSTKAASYTFRLEGNGPDFTTQAVRTTTISEGGAPVTPGVSTGTAPANTLTLPSAASDYLYVGSTAAAARSILLAGYRI